MTTTTTGARRSTSGTPAAGRTPASAAMTCQGTARARAGARIPTLTRIADMAAGHIPGTRPDQHGVEDYFPPGSTPAPGIFEVDLNSRRAARSSYDRGFYAALRVLETMGRTYPDMTAQKAT